MMMFSLSPSRSSFAPRIDASVRTRVVSWKDAAEMNDCVVSDAFVMPSRSGSAVDGDSFFFFARSLMSRKTCLSTCSPSRNSVSPGSRTFDAQDVMWVHRPLGEAVTGANAISLVHAQVLARGDLVRLCLHRLVDRAVVVDRVDANLALAALDLAEPNDTVDLRDRRWILGPARLEQLGDAGQTAGDVARLVRLTADLGDRRAGADALPVLHRELRAHRDDEVTHALFLAALLLHDLDVRMELLLTILDDDALAQASELVELFGHRLLFDDVDEADRTLDVGDDRVGVRIPAEDHLIALHFVAVLHHQDRA